MGGASKGAPLRLSRAQQAKSSMTSLLLLMISLFACFYTAGRLWQDAEMRYLLVGNSEKRFHQVFFLFSSLFSCCKCNPVVCVLLEAVLLLLILFGFQSFHFSFALCDFRMEDLCQLMRH
jgi:hypothetical protein